MKRNMELVRALALAIEEAPGGFAPLRFDLDGYSDEEISYHAYLMIDAGLATGSVLTTMDSSGPEAMLRSLTWAGHEFAEAAAYEPRWKKAMGIVKEKGGSVSLPVLSQLLAQLMKKEFGLD